MKKLFPISAIATNIVGLICTIIVYVVAIGACGYLHYTTSGNPILGFLPKVLFYVVLIYSIAGTIVAFVNYKKD